MKTNLLRIVKVGLCIVLILVCLLYALSTYANAYDHTFTQYLGTGSVAVAISPCRGINEYDLTDVGIISKTNQARDVSAVNGTNPHRGTDFNMTAGTEVYPIMGGTIYQVNNSDYNKNNQEANVVIKTTISNVDYYITYMHITIEDPSLEVGDVVDGYDKIGVIASYIKYSPHLHITCQKYADQIKCITGLYQFFTTNAFYNYGSDMDVITAGHFNGSTFYITAYFRSDTLNEPDGKEFHCKSITIYYKVYHVSTQSEIMHSTTFETSIDPYSHNLTYPSNYDSLTYTYAIDFSEFIGTEYKVECGDTIQFYMAAVREGHSDDDDDFFNTMVLDHSTEPQHDGTMDYSIWPMYYDHPDKGMTVTAPIIYGDSYTNTSTHEWSSEWTTVREATCTTVGIESRLCNNCGANWRNTKFNTNT
jgi:hypothetical protein